MDKIVRNLYLPTLNAITLAILLIAGIVMMNMLYLNDNEDDILFNSFLFLLFVVTNRFSLDLSKSKHKLKWALWVDLTELLFLIYLVLVFIYGAEYFGRIKVLMIPTFLLGVFLMLTMKGWRRENIN